VTRDETPDDDLREAEPAEAGDDEARDPRDPARQAAGEQADREGESRGESRPATGEPRSAGADR